MLPVILLVLCTVLRAVPHPANVTPMGGAAVLAGRTLPGYVAALSLLATLVVSDVLLGRLQGHPPFDAVTPFVYGGFAVQAGLGRALRGVRGGTVLAALLGALAFFVVSNLGVWARSGLYPADGAGLVACYGAALPFFGRSVVGDVGWALILGEGYRAGAAWVREQAWWAPVPVRRLGRL